MSEQIVRKKRQRVSFSLWNNVCKALFDQFQLLFLWIPRYLISGVLLNIIVWSLSDVTVIYLLKKWWRSFTPRLSEFEIYNNATLIFQNRPVSRLFTNIFYNLNFAEYQKCLFSWFLVKIRYYDFRKKSYFDYEPNCHLKNTFK